MEIYSPTSVRAELVAALFVFIDRPAGKGQGFDRLGPNGERTALIRSAP